MSDSGDQSGAENRSGADDGHSADDRAARPSRLPRRRRHLPRPIGIALAVLGPLALTAAYFTLPFGFLVNGEHLAGWFLLGGLLTLLALGMLATTVRAMSDRPGHPGLGILLLSWASILTFSAVYWALAIGHGQFAGIQTRLDALYFTGVTMSTVGYGDIHPTGQAARAIVLLQLVYTFSFVAGGITALGTRVRGRLSRRMAR
ncbi:MAG: two pore domain potassium channel family protein [Catenulispora sp.]|nr:two pore domain potassium channel family protein [Catenulispora sp.]